MTTAQDGGKVVNLTHRPPLPPRKHSRYSFLLEVESGDRKDFMLMKNPVTPAGIEPGTFRFVAQHLNHCATAAPLIISVASQKRRPFSAEFSRGNK